MDLQELARLVKSCRDKQKQYFRERTGTLLNECRDWERRVDAAVHAVLCPEEKQLFPDPPDRGRAGKPSKGSGA